MSRTCKRYPPQPRPARALTLMELLAAIVIMSFIALVVTPTGAPAAEARLLGAARLLVSDLEYARIQSIGSPADLCIVVFEAQGNGYLVARESDTAVPVEEPGSGLPMQRTFDQSGAAWLQNIVLDSSGIGPGQQVGFTSRGRLIQTSDVRITLRLGTSTVAVVVNAVTGESSIDL